MPIRPRRNDATPARAETTNHKPAPVLSAQRSLVPPWPGRSGKLSDEYSCQPADPLSNQLLATQPHCQGHLLMELAKARLLGCSLLNSAPPSSSSAPSPTTTTTTATCCCISEQHQLRHTHQQLAAPCCFAPPNISAADVEIRRPKSSEQEDRRRAWAKLSTQSVRPESNIFHGPRRHTSLAGATTTCRPAEGGSATGKSSFPFDSEPSSSERLTRASAGAPGYVEAPFMRLKAPSD